MRVAGADRELQFLGERDDIVREQGPVVACLAPTVVQSHASEACWSAHQRAEVGEAAIGKGRAREIHRRDAGWEPGTVEAGECTQRWCVAGKRPWPRNSA